MEAPPAMVRAQREKKGKNKIKTKNNKSCEFLALLTAGDPAPLAAHLSQH